jgi:hypothetical protein
MNKQDSDIGYEPKKTRGLFYLSAIAIAMGAVLAVGCNPSDPGNDDGEDLIDLDDPNPTPTVTGTSLFCEDPSAIVTSTRAADYVVDTSTGIPTYNISKETGGRTSDQPSELRANAGNNLKRLSVVVDPMTGSEDGVPVPIDITSDEWTGEDQVHPLLVSYTEQVLGDYEMGDGSADIGDPNHVDDAFVSISLDNGKSWKKERVGDTAMLNPTTIKSSTQVTWDGDLIDYPGHSHKMTMATQGNNIMVAWLDKYCPSGNPLDLEQVDGTYPDDLYKVNGTQGSVDYNLPCTVEDPESNDFNCAPNGKAVYEVPFSCVWTARGVFDSDPASPTYGLIEWRKEQQLTSGTRDANKLWIAPAEVGFAMTWQEDPEGLRAGKGEGPGVGWSGATTNHGADIWYTYITMDDFDDVIVDEGDPEVTGDETVSDDPAVIAALANKAKPAVNYTYPVRITDNEVCFFENDTKLYCEQVCTDSTTVDSNNQKDQDIVRCLTGDIDPLPQWDGDTLVEDAYAALDGDTGASRPAITILKTNTGEFITVLAYEETKGLSDAEPGVPEDPDALDIALEGKAVLAEAFHWNDPVTISAGNIVNVKVPRYDPATQTFDTSDMIFENARRVVLINQVDACEMTANSFPIGFLYKQSYETQGGASDMYIRMLGGFTLDNLVDEVTNVSAQSTTATSAAEADVDLLSWSPDNLDDYVGENPYDNTFSPRAFMRGDEIYTGFAYTPSGDRTDNGQVATNFWIHRYVDDGAGLQWNGPQQVSFEQGGTSALDPRFVPTPKYNASGLESDQSNPNVVFMSYNTADADHELDVYYSRSTDKGRTFEYGSYTAGEDGIEGTEDDVPKFAKISAWPLPVEEKEVQLIGSPDGTMGFNVWLQESETPPTGTGLEVTVDGGETVNIPDNALGLESWIGRIDYVDPATIVVEP